MKINPLTLIEDIELRRLAEIHDLLEWEWGQSNPALVAIMIEAAAIVIRELYQDRDMHIYVHQSGTIAVFGGPFFHWQINPEDKVEIDAGMDWEDDPVVKQYRCKRVLSLSWDERGLMDEEGQ